MLDPTKSRPGGTGQPEGAGVLVLVAHPSMEHSRVNRRLMQAAAQAPDPVSSTRANAVEVRDLYALYPDYVIDGTAERKAAEAAGLIVWLHPTHWYGMPPLMKLWCDEVLSYGWAYGQDGLALKGKDLWLVTTTGGPADAYHPQGYNRYAFEAFLPPYDQTAALCGMRFLPPWVIHGAHKLSEAEIQADAATLARRLSTWPDWPELAELSVCEQRVVPKDERPQDAQEPARQPGAGASA